MVSEEEPSPPPPVVPRRQSGSVDGASRHGVRANNIRPRTVCLRIILTPGIIIKIIIIIIIIITMIIIIIIMTPGGASRASVRRAERARRSKARSLTASGQTPV